MLQLSFFSFRDIPKNFDWYIYTIQFCSPSAHFLSAGHVLHQIRYQSSYANMYPIDYKKKENIDHEKLILPYLAIGFLVLCGFNTSKLMVIQPISEVMAPKLNLLIFLKRDDLRI